MKQEKLKFRVETDQNSVKKYSVDVKVAKSPSDVLWFNYGIPKKKHILRFVLIVILTSLLIWFVGFLFLGGISAQIYINYRKNPPKATIDCYTLNDRVKDLLSWDHYLAMASYEYLYLNDFKTSYGSWTDLQYKISESGSLACFCKAE